MDFADILASSEFCTSHDKHKANHPWLSHSYIIIIHEAVRYFDSITIDYKSKAILLSGHSLPASTYVPTINLISQTHALLKSEILQHSIDNFSTTQESYA